MEEQIVKVEPWNEIKSEQAETVRLEPSGISVAGVEYAINYTNRNWWVKVANLTEHMSYTSTKMTLLPMHRKLKSLLWT